MSEDGKGYMTEERRMIRDAAREFTMKEVLPVANKLDGPDGEIPMELRQKMADMGYFGIMIPEEHGGLGLGLVKAGTGTLVLAGTNTFSGPLMVSAGVLLVASERALGGGTAEVSVASGASLQLQGGGTLAAKPLSRGGAGAAGQPGALVNLSDNNTFSGAVSLSSDATISLAAGSLSFSHAGGISGSQALTINGAGGGTVRRRADPSAS